MSEHLTERSLVIQFSAGQNPETGKDVTKSKSFKNIRLEALESNLADFSKKYAALSSHTHQKTFVINYHDISSL